MSLLYGSGLRVSECLRLRCKDIDFDYKAIRVWDGKGGKNRVVTLSVHLLHALGKQISLVKEILEKDKLNPVYSGVYMPHRLREKYPNAAYDHNWHYLFPSTSLSIDPESKLCRRHHIDERTLQRAVKTTAKSAGLTKEVKPHTLRHYVPFLTMSCSVF
jgi:integrase